MSSSSFSIDKCKVIYDRFNENKSLTIPAITEAATARVESLFTVLSDETAIKKALSQFKAICDHMNAENQKYDRKESLLSSQSSGSSGHSLGLAASIILAETIDDLQAYETYEETQYFASRFRENPLLSPSGSGVGVAAGSSDDISILFTCAKTFADHYDRSLSHEEISAVEPLIKAGPKFMTWNNADPAVNGKYTYHDAPHGAEMLMDVLLKSGEFIFRDPKFNFLSNEEKKLLVTLQTLCASYHDAYFRGTRMLDEGAAAQLLIRQLLKQLATQVDLRSDMFKELESFIELIIVGGTLPIFKGLTMPALIETLRNPNPEETARIILFDLAKILAACDVHRTNEPQLISQERIRAFNRVVKADENLATAQAKLKQIAMDLYRKHFDEFKTEYPFEDYFESLMDKCGQNIRVSDEMKSSESVKALIQRGRRLLSGDGMLELDLSDETGEAVINCFHGLVSSGNAKFMLCFARTVGGSFNLWHAHSQFLNQLEVNIKTLAEKKELGTFLALRAGAQDGVYFQALLNDPVFTVSGMVERLFECSHHREAIKMDALIETELSPPVRGAQPFSAFSFSNSVLGVEGAQNVPVEEAVLSVVAPVVIVPVAEVPAWGFCGCFGGLWRGRGRHREAPIYAGDADEPG